MKRDHCSFEREDRGPGVFENVETDGAGLTRNVWMVYLCDELRGTRVSCAQAILLEKSFTFILSGVKG